MVGPVKSGRSPRSARLFKSGYEETLEQYTFGELEQHVRVEIGTLDLEMAAIGAGLLATRVHASEAEERVPVTDGQPVSV
jgi:hypothetical protein